MSYVVQATLTENPSADTVMYAVERGGNGQIHQISSIKVIEQFEDDDTYGTIVDGTIVEDT